MDAPPSDNLYMKGLPAGIAEDTLRAIFGSYGTVISARVLPAPPGITDAAALVRMSTVQEAQWLVENSSSLASTLSMNVQIRFAVNTKLGKGGSPAAAPMQPSPCGQASNKLYMRGLPLGIPEEHLRAIMSAYGTVLSCKVLPPLAGASDSAGIVQMGNTEQAQWLVDKLNGNIPQGLSTPVVVKFKSEGQFTQGPTPSDQLTAAAVAAVSAGVVPNVSPPGGQPSDNLYMCGFPPGTTEERLKAVFGAYGVVISCKVLPPPAGKSDSACLLRMGSVEEAQWLVEHVNGNIPQGMAEPITIRFADKSRAPPGVPTPPPPVVPASLQSSNLYMKGFPPETDDSTLRYIFGQYGVVVSCRVMPTISGGNDVAALVQMGSTAEAQWLVDNVNGNIPQGLAVPIQIRYANNPKGTVSTGKWPSIVMGNGVVPQPLMSTQAAPLPALTNGVGPLLTSVEPAEPSENLYMKGFPLGTSTASVRHAIGQYGSVVNCKLLTLPPGHNCSAWLLQMSSVEEATWLVDNLHDNIPVGFSDPVEVRFYPNFAAPLGRFSPY